MKKGELLKLRTLKATKKMMKMAENDSIRREKVGTWAYSYVRESYKYGLYMRCQILNGILKVAFFLAEHMRMGAVLPAYELFINKETGEFLTYDRKLSRWLTAKLDMLPWPEYVICSEKKWINTEGSRTIKRFLDVPYGGYKGILEYQLRIRANELKQRHKRETDPWDLDMEQTPELPKDWDKWVSKVGIPDNYIFYRYDRRGVTEGYCTYCEKQVPIRHPKHNRQGTCPCCHHKVIFKSEGKAAGTVNTDTVCMYLMQRCEDGMMIREFTGKGFTVRRITAMRNAAIQKSGVLFMIMRDMVCGLTIGAIISMTVCGGFKQGSAIHIRCRIITIIVLMRDVYMGVLCRIWQKRIAQDRSGGSNRRGKGIGPGKISGGMGENSGIGTSGKNGT